MENLIFLLIGFVIGIIVSLGVGTFILIDKRWDIGFSEGFDAASELYKGKEKDVHNT